MAAGFLSAPGAQFGPCKERCAHIDCAATRRDSETKCRICADPIGYDTRFFREGNSLVHELCALNEVECDEVWV